MKKGFIHLIPVLVIALGISLASIGIVAKVRTVQNPTVLSSSNENKGQGSSNSKKGLGNEEGNKANSPNASSNKDDHSGQGSSQSKKTENNVQPNSNKQKVQNINQEVEEQTSDRNFTGVEEASPQPATPSGRKIRTNFPITVNPLTNEKIVTTPSGTKVVIIPEVAIQNMIKAGFPVILPEPSPEPSPTPQEGTPSATSEASPETGTESESNAVSLTEVNGQLVYEIPAIKKQKFLAFLPIDVKVTGLVSAESGKILSIKKSFFDRILDFLSF